MYSPDVFTQLRKKISSAISTRYRLRSTSANALPAPIGTSSFAGPVRPCRTAWPRRSMMLNRIRLTARIVAAARSKGLTPIARIRWLEIHAPNTAPLARRTR